MNRVVSALTRRPGAAMLESACVLTAVVVHSVAAIGLTAAVVIVSGLRRGTARRPSTHP